MVDSVRATTRLVLDDAAFNLLLHDPAGAVAEYLFVGADRVKFGAQLRANKKTGKMAANIVKRDFSSGVEPGVRVIAQEPYSIYIHEGTVAHGPVNARMLRWFGPDGNPVFRPWVRGIKANPFLRDSLPLFFE